MTSSFLWKPFFTHSYYSHPSLRITASSSAAPGVDLNTLQSAISQVIIRMVYHSLQVLTNEFNYHLL